MSQSNDKGRADPERKAQGVVMIRGGRVTIPPITIDLKNGVISPDPVVLGLGYDLYPQWLLAAIERVEEAEAAAARLDEVWVDGSNENETAALEAELRAGMQAIVAAAAAIDSFYGTVKHLAPADNVGPKPGKPKPRKRPSRHAVISEHLRRSFEIKPKAFAQLKQILSELFRFRDEAVHPGAKEDGAVPHPRLEVGVERRFRMFAVGNATQAVSLALSVIGQTLERPKSKFPKLVEHCGYAVELVRPLIDRWEATRPPLWERSSP